MNDEKKVAGLIRFDFPPGATPEEIAKAIRDMAKRAAAEEPAAAPELREPSTEIKKKDEEDR
jgi:hypothetical protein